MATIVRFSPPVQKPAPDRRPDRKWPWLEALRRSSATRSDPLAEPTDPAPPPVATLSDADALWLTTLRPWAFHIVRRVGIHGPDAEDAVQEAFCRIAVEWDTFPIPPDADPRKARRLWLATHILREGRRLLDSRRRIREHESTELSPIHHTPLVPSAEAMVAAREQVRSLEHATSPERWDLWVAHEIDGLSVIELARLTERPLATIYNLLRLVRLDFAAAEARETATERRATGTSLPRRRP